MREKFSTIRPEAGDNDLSSSKPRQDTDTDHNRGVKKLIDSSRDRLGEEFGSAEVIESGLKNLNRKILDDPRNAETLAAISIGGGGIFRYVPPELKPELAVKLHAFKTAARFSPPSLFKGNPTATGYDSAASNFSTQTRIITLSNGQKLFAVYNYPLSWIHRAISDRLNKFIVGFGVRKADSKGWKNLFIARSQVPLIEYDDPNVVLMPYLPNINLKDLFDRQKEMKDFGECRFAEKYDEEDLLKVLEKAAWKLRQIHVDGGSWGEPILPNMIIDQNEEVHICDPENLYSPDLSPVERQAKDLLLFVVSAAGAAVSRGIRVEEVVRRILNCYDGEKMILAELKKIASIKTEWWRRLLFGSVKGFFGVSNYQEFAMIKEVVVKMLV